MMNAIEDEEDVLLERGERQNNQETIQEKQRRRRSNRITGSADHDHYDDEDDHDDDDDAHHHEHPHRWHTQAKYGLAAVIFMALCSIRLPSSYFSSSGSLSGETPTRSASSGGITTTTLSSSSSGTFSHNSAAHDRETYLREYGPAILTTTVTPDKQSSTSIVPLSPNLDHLADTNDLPIDPHDVPFFLHVPRCGGSTVKDILGSCYGVVEASDVGARNGHHKDLQLGIVYGQHGSSFVNVDTTTLEGIKRAKALGLVESELAGIVVTQYLHPAATLFNEKQRGRLFAMVRHPIDRAVSLFHYLGVAHWEPTYDPDLGYISIEMYARSKRIEHNWMTRYLSNELHGDLTERHLAMAKEVMRRKMLVGLLEQKSESWRRFERYFGWSPKTQEERECRDKLLHWGWSNKHSHPQVEEGSPVWDLLHTQNALDMKLYEYAQTLFEEQSAMFREH